MLTEHAEGNSLALLEMLCLVMFPIWDAATRRMVIIGDLSVMVAHAQSIPKLPRP